MKVFLIGMMGAGKSTLGPVIAEKVSFDFVDTDDLIEQEANCSILDIFHTKGESYFRDLEAKTIRSLKNRNHIVIATGGGLPLYKDNMAWMNKNGLTFFLDTPYYLLYERLSLTMSTRPLLKNLSRLELFSFIHKACKKRAPIYNKAQHRLNRFTASKDQINSIIFQIRMALNDNNDVITE